jgi:hypothetical protein
MAAQEEIKFRWVAYILINYSACNFRNMWAKLLSKHGTKQQLKIVCVPNQVEYFHSCPPSGDHCGCQGRSLCGASSAQLRRWYVASHCTEISMPEEGMASIKYDVCYLGTTWRAKFSLKLFLPSLSPGFLVPTLVWIGPRLLRPYGWKRLKKLSIALVWWSEESSWNI